MRKLYLPLTILLASLTTTIFAAKITEDDAALVAKNFYFERISQYQQTRYDDISLWPAIQVYNEGELVYYAFNVKPEGMIILSAWDEAYPVLAYSFNGSYDANWLPENFTAWMGQYSRQIRHAVNDHVAPDQHTRATWDRYLNTSADRLTPLSGREVEPMLTTTWDQGKYYNQMCPADPAGPGGHCVTGCVATALGQLVNYFRWPDTGTGSYSYECPPYGTLSADFENTTYRWDLMETSVTHPNLSIAEILYHLGVSVDMVYGPDGSGMYNHKAAYTLKTFFKYSPETQYVFRDSTSMDWDSLIVAHLDQGIPMYYAGWSVPDINGHAFICDGYQDSAYYHFNWGWGGSYDGYFYTDDLTPGGSLFNLAQELVIHAVPDTVNYDYPVYCSGNSEFSTLFGTVEDGSGPIFDYQAQSDCQWLIAPADSVQGITLDFLTYALGEGDTVFIYDGESTSDPLLAELTAYSQPGPVDTDGNKMLVVFHSDDVSTGLGFLAEFSSDIPVYCNGNTMLTAQTDTISDGSGNWDYQNNTQCIWMIDPEGASEVTLYFTDFETDDSNDFVKIYDQATQQVLAQYSGSYAPGVPDPVTSPSGKMFMIFKTDYTGRAAGWSAYYQTDLVGVREDMNALSTLKVYPNPSDGNFMIEMKGSFDGYSDLQVCDIYGRIVFRENINDFQGMNKLNMNHLPPGLYYLSLKGEAATAISKKIIIQ